MDILITGASGFTGRHFRHYAETAGHQVMALIADLKDKDAVRNEVAKLRLQAVVHLAGISFAAHEDAGDYYAVNVIGTMHLLEALAELPERPEKVLLAGSAHVYGNSETSPISESQCPAPGSHYAISKLAMEFISRSYMDRLPIVITRPFNYTGPGQAEHFVIPKLVSHFARRAPYIELGNIEVEREFNDVRMVCEAYLNLLEKGIAGEIYNVCTERTYALSDIIAILERLCGHQMEVRSNAKFLRVGEIGKLCGSREKLIETVGFFNDYRIEDTMAWMLGQISR